MNGILNWRSSSRAVLTAVAACIGAVLLASVIRDPAISAFGFVVVAATALLGVAGRQAETRVPVRIRDERRR